MTDQKWRQAFFLGMLLFFSVLGCPSSGENNLNKPFPAKLPLEKPTDRPLSAAMHRLYDRWNPHGDRANELFSHFKYSPLAGFSYENSTSRRDPSKVLKIDGMYYVWYTHRQTAAPPSGPQQATDTIPSYDWDLAEIWYATSVDGFTWTEQGVAIKRLPKPRYGWRSVSTPDVLVWDGKYYLYYQGFNEIPGLKGDRAAATVAEVISAPARVLRLRMQKRQNRGHKSVTSSKTRSG